jgi:hypothetical protein
MESGFLSELDNGAANSMLLLECGIPEGKWTSKDRSAWSRFLLTQLLRAPEDIEQLKYCVQKDWAEITPELQEAYERQRSEGDPISVAEYLRDREPGHTDEFALGVIRVLMDHPKLCGRINNMHWCVRDIPISEYPLLTSDRPVWMTATLSEPDAFLWLPIGPRKLFIATVQPETDAKLKGRAAGAIAKIANKLIVQHAMKYVYGQTSSMLPFVSRHLGTVRHSSLAERLAAARKQRIIRKAQDER